MVSIEYGRVITTGIGDIQNNPDFYKTSHRCRSVHKKKTFLPNLCSNRQLEPPLPLNFFYRILCHSALAPNFSIDPLFRKGDTYGLVGALPWVWQIDSSFRDLLPSRPRRRKLKMWFPALEFAVSRTVAKYIFHWCRTRTRTYQFFFF